METSRPQLGLGEYLRGEREKRHITIEQVASATKINIKLLHALESDNYDALPAKPFVRGFVTSYTRYVGLDHREVLARFDMFLDEKSGLKFKRPEDAPHIFVEREGQTDSSKTWLSIVMVSILVFAVVAFAILKPSLKHHRGHKKDQPITNEEVITVVPPPSDSSPITAKAPSPKSDEAKPEDKLPVMAMAKPAPETSAPAPAPTVEPVKAEPKAETKAEAKPEPKPEAKPEAKPEPKVAAKPLAPGKLPPIPENEVKYRLIVRAVEDAWVKYQVDDRPVQAYTLRKDKKIFVRARTSLRFTSAKPSALEISYDNKEFRPVGSGAKLIIMPKEAQEQFKSNPFVAPNPAYLSTPNQ